MLPNKIKYYQILDERIPEIPIRSRFYHLQPLGIGTPMSECLTSYICRLAAAHSVSVGNFFEFALVPELQKHYLKTPAGLTPATNLSSGFRYRIKNINGLGKIATDWVEAIERMTLRSDLSCLTALKMSEVLSCYYVNRGLQAWCPFCFEDMKNAGSEPYYPLLWSIADVSVCHIHQTPLIEICPNCSKTFYPLSKKVKPGFCSRCQLWLGTSQEQTSQSSFQWSDKEFEWNLFSSKEISELISFISNPSTKSFDDTIAQTIKLCVGRATNGVMTAFSKLIQIHPITFYGWYRGFVRPHLKDILRICYCLNLTLLEFFTQPEIITTKEIKVREWLGLYKKPPRPTPRPFNSKLIKSKLKKYVSIYPPLSMPKVGLEIGYDKKFLNRAFPEITNKIKSNYSEYQQSIWDTKRKELEKEIKSAVYKLEERGEFVSARRVAKFLNKPTYISRRDIAQIVFDSRKMGKPAKNRNK